MHYKTAIYYLLLCTRQQADSIMPATVVSLLDSGGQQLRKGERFLRSGDADHIYEMVDARSFDELSMSALASSKVEDGYGTFVVALTFPPIK